MNNSTKVFILSPHFDDAAYGLTLTISQLLGNKINVTLVNCFTITKWTALPVENKDVKSVSLLRATEDKAYNALFDNTINLVNLDLLDAPLRNGYIFQSSSFAPDEWKLVEQLSGLLDDIIDGILLCPLGIGNHIDHAICRAAVVQLYQKLPVVFYEDLPYAHRITEEEITDHVDELAQQLNTEFQANIIRSENSKINKEQAVGVYQSQLTAEICSEILARMNTVGGERIWGEPEKLSKLVTLLK